VTWNLSRTGSGDVFGERRGTGASPDGVGHTGHLVPLRFDLRGGGVGAAAGAALNDIGRCVGSAEPPIRPAAGLTAGSQRVLGQESRLAARCLGLLRDEACDKARDGRHTCPCRSRSRGGSDRVPWRRRRWPLLQSRIRNPACGVHTALPSSLVLAAPPEPALDRAWPSSNTAGKRPEEKVSAK
jgi:hypothetical protein